MSYEKIFSDNLSLQEIYGKKKIYYGYKHIADPSDLSPYHLIVKLTNFKKLDTNEGFSVEPITSHKYSFTHLSKSIFL